MPIIVVGRPAQHLQAHAPRGERPQPLASPVPVDQEDQPRSQEGQVGQHVGPVPRLVGPQAEVVEVLTEPRRPPRHRVLPAHVETVEQVLKEDQAVDMHVGVGQRDPPPLDVNDQDVGLGHPDVVLDHQPLAAAGGGRPQARVVELEFTGPVDAGHEGGDKRAVVLEHSVDLAPSILSVASRCWSRFSSWCRSMTSRWRLSPASLCPEVSRSMESPEIRSSAGQGARDRRSCRRSRYGAAGRSPSGGAEPSGPQRGASIRRTSSMSRSWMRRAAGMR